MDTPKQTIAKKLRTGKITPSEYEQMLAADSTFQNQQVADADAGDWQLWRDKLRNMLPDAKATDAKGAGASAEPVFESANEKAEKERNRRLRVVEEAYQEGVDKRLGETIAGEKLRAESMKEWDKINDRRIAELETRALNQGAKMPDWR